MKICDSIVLDYRRSTFKSVKNIEVRSVSKFITSEAGLNIYRECYITVIVSSMCLNACD